MNRIYGNDYLLSTLKNMVSRDKAAHTVMFYGEKGSGKKLLARFYTMLLLCENPIEGEPCGCCTACRNIEAGYHPDVIYPEKSGKLGGYSVETAGSVASDAYVKPNRQKGLYLRRLPEFRQPSAEQASEAYRGTAGLCLLYLHG